MATRIGSGDSGRAIHSCRKNYERPLTVQGGCPPIERQTDNDGTLIAVIMPEGNSR